MYTLAENKILMLKPDEIVPSAFVQRTTIDRGELDRLCESVAASGIIEPLCVRKTAEGKYELICGARRLIAAKAIKLRRVPCIVRKSDEISSAVYALSENLHKSGLSFFDESAAIDVLLRMSGFTQSELALRLGISSSTLCNKLKLLKLKENSRKRIIAAGLSERHAVLISGVPEEFHEKLLDRIIADGLNAKQTESEIEKLTSPKAEEEAKPQQKPIRKAAIGDIRLFANSLSKMVLTLNNAGIVTNSKRIETDSYIEYKVHIKKGESAKEEQFEQLCIC